MTLKTPSFRRNAYQTSSVVAPRRYCQHLAKIKKTLLLIRNRNMDFIAAIFQVFLHIGWA